MSECVYVWTSTRIFRKHKPLLSRLKQTQHWGDAELGPEDLPLYDGMTTDLLPRLSIHRRENVNKKVAAFKSSGC